jgi:hypothetical protein
LLGIPVLAGLLLLFFSMFGFLVSTHLEIFAAIHLVSKSNLDLAPNTVLVQWILSMDEQGQSPRVATVQATANLLLANRDNSTPPPTLDIKWVNQFINRHSELKTQFS